jgi:heterodisulfide reductase subunit C
MALLVLVACVIFLIRRNVINIKRFHNKEMTSWPKSDANIILIVEILLMTAFLTMNAADFKAGMSNVSDSAFLVSSNITGLLPNSQSGLHYVERFCWWFHIIGIFGFLNYIPYSKHFHIMLAFPNVWYAPLTPKGQATNMQSVTNEVKLMLDPSSVPPADATPPSRFGAKDVTDLTWKSLMDAYTCTECGRCTDNCPANQTGKELSPRKIMMDTRDRVEELGAAKRKNGIDFEDGKSLFDLVKQEELLACTTCNACVEACPVNINPLTIILEMRRFMVMEDNKVPQEWNMMFTNIENNGAPWAFPATDRGNWVNE